MDDDSLDSIAQGENVLSRYYFGLMYRYMLTDITLGDQSVFHFYFSFVIRIQLF